MLDTSTAAGRSQAATSQRTEAEFALVVEGTLLVLGDRFGESAPWSSPAPFHWHMVPRDERIVPAEIESGLS